MLHHLRREDPPASSAKTNTSTCSLKGKIPGIIMAGVVAQSLLFFVTLSYLGYHRHGEPNEHLNQLRHPDTMTEEGLAAPFTVQQENGAQLEVQQEKDGAVAPKKLTPQEESAKEMKQQESYLAAKSKMQPKKDAAAAAKKLIQDEAINTRKVQREKERLAVLSKAQQEKGSAVAARKPTQDCRCVDCDDDKLCGGLWKGLHHLNNNNEPTESTEPTAILQVHVVASYCDKSLDWLKKWIRPSSPTAYEIASVHVISKCDNHRQTGAPNAARVEVSSSAGRWDHSYAHYIATAILNEFPPDQEKLSNSSVVVFLKEDSPWNKVDLHQRYTFQEMVPLASANGFVCNNTPKRWSAYHEKETLFGFHIEEDGKKDTKNVVDSSPEYKNLGDYYNKITSIGKAGDSHSPPSIAQVCYGGVFATTVEQIWKQPPTVWQNMEETLSRGGKIEEEYYAERLWALLLAVPVEPHEEKALRLWGNGRVPKFPTSGALLHKEGKKG